MSSKDIAELDQLWRAAKDEQEVRERNYAENKRLIELATLEKQRKRIAPVRRFANLCRNAIESSLVTAAYMIPSQLLAEDRKLISCWVKSETNENMDSQRRRMLSARLAEKAVMSFFKDRGSVVHDVSIEQIAKPESRNWLYFDIDVDGVPIDVKNARRSPENPERYVNHCVPKFKESRNLQNVQIAGVLSYWLPEEKMHSPDYRILFLGLTSYHEVDKLQNEFIGSTLQIELKNGLEGPKFLPPWLFSFPEELYRSRAKSIAQLKEVAFPDWRLCRDEALNPIPACISAGRQYRFTPELKLNSGQYKLTDLLLRREKRFGLSVPIIFLSLLEHFLMLVNDGSEERYNAEDYAQLIFPTADRDFPLFCYDPLHTVNALLTTLSSLWMARTKELLGFRIFRLSNLNILQGKKSPGDERWQTIIAYCGGWLDAPIRPCGTIPLIIGENRSCVNGKLVCHKCGFCCNVCDSLNRFR